MRIPEYVQNLMDVLENAGFQAWAVGGCVRDAALGIEPHDYDLCTNALPEQTKELFSGYQLVLAGLKHGTVAVVTPVDVVEITTFRTEGDYSDNRHPGWVNFVTSIEEDLSRRDFTINAMAYSPLRGYADPFGGLTDLKRKRLRAVGNPTERFREDSLRILRGARFAARFGMKIEEETRMAMEAEKHLMDGLARERVFSELVKFFTDADGDLIVDMAPVLAQVIPELKATMGFDQKNPHHAYDVFTHMAKVTGRLPKVPELRFAGILHDIGKPRCMTMDDKGVGHFRGHDLESAAMADVILHRLKAPTAFREEVVWLVETHMSHYAPEKRSARRALSRHGIDRVRRLVALQRSDIGGKGVDGKDPALNRLGAFLALAEELAQGEGELTLKSLAVKGGDLMRVGYKPTPELGKAMNRLLDAVIAEEVPNEKEALLTLAKTWLK